MVNNSEMSISQAIGIIEAEIAGICKSGNTDDRYSALQIALVMMQKQEEPALLNLKEFCEYTGLGMTKAREILKQPNSTFTVRIGNRLYANKKLFDKYLERCAQHQIPI